MSVKKAAKKTAKPPSKAKVGQAPVKKVAKQSVYSRAKLTTSLIDSVVQYIEVGVAPKVAAMACGISGRAYHGWIDKGAKDEANGTLTLHSEFSFRMQVAEAMTEIALVSEIRTIGNVDWKSRLELLKRRYSSRWNDKVEVKQEITGATLALTKEVKDMTAEEAMKAYQALLGG